MARAVSPCAPPVSRTHRRTHRLRILRYLTLSLYAFCARRHRDPLRCAHRTHCTHAPRVASRSRTALPRITQNMAAAAGCIGGGMGGDVTYVSAGISRGAARQRTLSHCCAAPRALHCLTRRSTCLRAIRRRVRAVARGGKALLKNLLTPPSSMRVPYLGMPYALSTTA